MPPPQKPAKKRAAQKSAASKPRAASARSLPVPAQAPKANGTFTPAITADNRLVLVDERAGAVIFTQRQTESIAELMLANFKD
jgi:hypothetical protein